MASLGQQVDYQECDVPFWSSTDVLIYGNELIELHPATSWFVGIIVHWKMHLFRFLEHDGDKQLRLAWCIASGIMNCEPTPGRFFVFEATAWRQLDIIATTVFVLKCLRGGFGSTRQQVISMQQVHGHGLGEFVRCSPNSSDHGQLEDADFKINDDNFNRANNDFEGPLEDFEFDVSELDGFGVLEDAAWEGDMFDDIMVDDKRDVDGVRNVADGQDKDVDKKQEEHRCWHNNQKSVHPMARSHHQCSRSTARVGIITMM